MAGFIHLHVHSEYSLLDGLPKIPDIVKTAKKMGMPAVALTDHGAMYGAIEFYKECQQAGIKPLIGIEAYTVNKDHKIKEGKEDKENHHLILIAKNLQGYKNLMKLTTIAHLEGFYYRPRFDKKTLSQYKEGLICLSACIKGEIGEALIQENYEKAKQIATWYQEVFQDDFYLEIQRHHPQDFIEKAQDPVIKDSLRRAQKEETLWNDGIIRLSRELGIPLVATNDVHYLKQEDAVAQDALVCISTAKNISDINRLRYVDVPTLHFLNEEEARSLFADIPDAIDNTIKVADKVEVEIELGKWYFPNIDLPEGKTAPDFLKETCYQRLPLKYPNPTQEVKDRLEYELDVIIKRGYAPYFLMLADLVNWCSQKEIITNTRGSAAGCLVSYVLGITNVDPLKYGLPFERFLNPYRPKPPDIDLDIADNRREELINHVVEKYGADKVAQICTFGRMLARAAVRDVGRVLGFPYAVPDRIAKMIPLGSQGFPMTIEKALSVSSELKESYENEPVTKQILDLAMQIEGNARHASVHAAGIVVSPTQMTDYCPLQLEPNGTKIITQYEMHACEDIGLVKFDILGIRNLSILNAAVEIIEKETGEKIDLSKIPLDDKKTYEMLSRGETMGVFQLGGTGMTKWLKELKPNRIEDLMVMIALFRPGPMAIIPEFIARKNKKSKVTYFHPKMEKTLEKSYGLLVYQEDVLFTAIELAGYNWETVDKLRTAIGKKIPAEMEKQHDIFVEGCQKHSGLSKEEAEKIWSLFVPFQGYGFNKAHAASYGIVSYQTAYLKAHYPVEYMTALLTAESGNTDKIVEGVAECKRMGIIVLPPDINKSGSDFTIEKNEKSLNGKAIRFGLNAIKNVGEAALEEILKAREKGEFKSFCDFYLRVNGQKVNKKVLESLIKAGAMDRFGKRSAMLAGLDALRQKCDQITKQRSDGQVSLFGSSSQTDSIIPQDNFPDIDEYKKEDLMALEKELLGFFLTDHPLSPVLKILDSEVDFKIGRIDPESANLNPKVKVGGILSSLRIILTKKNGSEMAFATLEDDTGKIELVIFPKIFSEFKNFLVKDSIVIIEGKLEQGDENLTLVVDKVIPISSQIPEKSVDFVITIPSGTSPKTLVELNKLLRDHPGDKKGVLVFENGNGSRKKLELNFGVDYNEILASQIDSLLKS